MLKYTMSYVKFENTFNALYELVDEECFEEECLSDDEKIYRKKLIQLCATICVEYGGAKSNVHPYQD